MACCERNTGIMLILVLCLALWNLSNCAVIGTVLLPKRSYSDKEGQRGPTLPTPSTFDLGRLTLKHKDGDDKPTPAHFDWNRFTVEPIDWDRFRFTRKPFDWERVTFSPDSYNYNHGDDTSLMLAIFLPTAAGLVIVFLCKYFVCNDERNSNSEISTPILHPPPRRVFSPPTNVQFSSQNDTRTTQSARQELFSVASNLDSSVTDSSNRSNPTDKPPGYSDVVLADLSGRQSQFPEVKPAIPETPPPQYDNKNMRY